MKLRQSQGGAKSIVLYNEGNAPEMYRHTVFSSVDCMGGGSKFTYKILDTVELDAAHASNVKPAKREPMPVLH